MNEEADDVQDLLIGQADKLFEKLPMLGPVVWLQLQDKTQRYNFIGDIEWRVIPPITLGQCKLYMKDKAPLAYVSWAKVSDEVHDRISKGTMKLAPGEWDTGTNLWLVDVISPFGGVKEIIEDLKSSVLNDSNINYLAAGVGGEGLVVKQL